MQEKNKKIYMWIWVIGTTAVIAGIWLSLMRYNIRISFMTAGLFAERGLKAMDDAKLDLDRRLNASGNSFEINPLIETNTTTNETATSTN